MSHMPTGTSPDEAQVIAAIKSLQSDLNQSRQQFDSSYRAFQRDINRTETLISRLLQGLQPPITQDKWVPEPRLIQDESERNQQPKRKQARCPHPDCKNIPEPFRRQDNIIRHYTKHIPNQTRCEGCQRDILWKCDLPHHINHCLKPDHMGLEEAENDWKQALHDARAIVTKTNKKRPRATEATTPRRKAPKLLQTSDEREEQSQDILSSSPAPEHAHVAADNLSTPSIHHASPAVPIRAPFSDGYTMETHGFEVFSYARQDLSMGPSSEADHVPDRAPFSHSYTMDGPIIVGEDDLAAFVANFGENVPPDLRADHPDIIPT